MTHHELDKLFFDDQVAALIENPSVKWDFKTPIRTLMAYAFISYQFDVDGYAAQQRIKFYNEVFEETATKRRQAETAHYQMFLYPEDSLYLYSHTIECKDAQHSLLLVKRLNKIKASAQTDSLKAALNKAFRGFKTNHPSLGSCVAARNRRLSFSITRIQAFPQKTINEFIKIFCPLLWAHFEDIDHIAPYRYLEDGY